MKIQLFAFLLMLVPATAFVSAPAVHPDDILGTWVAAENKARVQIYKSGNRYFGKIVWLKEPVKDGKIKTDKHNPDPSKRSNPVVGLVVLRNFVFDDGQWVQGEVYDPSSGNEYSCRISMPNKNTMKVRGYLGISLLGRTEVWKRA
ncbi:MAG TPA: DUF2147 domain-containing protein [Chitinophagaceae bacterium]